MKILVSLAVLFLIAVFTGCSRSNELANPKSINLKIQQCNDVFFPDDTVTICFDSLLTDSRCPHNVVCIWEGYAAGKFSFTVNNQTSIFDLSATKDLYQAYTTDTIIAGYKIEFLDLTPYPDILIPSPATNKTAVLRITKP
jgi:hypothetical protein